MDSKADAGPLDISVIQVTLGEMMGKLEDGIKAFNEGRRDEARKQFVAVARENPQDENIWGWLYKVSNTDEERVKCLERILKINPRHQQAMKLLREIESKKVLAPSMPAPPPIVNKPVQPQKQNNNTLLIIIGTVAVVFFFCCIVFAIMSSPSSKQIKYVVTGSATSAFITYTNEQGGTEQVNVYLPFEKEYTVESGAVLSLAAQSDGVGSITCEIWVGGEKVKTSTSTAEYGVVTCTEFVQ